MYKKSDYVVAEKVGEAFVLFDEVKEVFYSFEEIEAVIWNNIEEKSPADIIALICEEYDVALEQAEKDINNFCEELSKRGLLNEIK